MEGIALVHSPHPLLAAANRHIGVAQWRPGDTLAEVLAKAGIFPFVPCVVLYNGTPARVDDWGRIVPAAGDLITVRALVHGDGKSNPVAAVLSIALMVAAPYMATAMLGADAAAIGASIGLSAQGVISLASGAIGLIGNAIIGAVFKPNMPKLSQSQSLGSSASPTYSLSGSQNRLRPYEPLPLIYGKHRFTPDLGARPYTSFSGRDQILWQIFNCGLSNVLLSDWKIGDTPLSSYSDWDMVEANASGLIPGFFENVDTLEGGALGGDQAWITRTLPANTIRAEIDLQGSLYQVDKKTGEFTNKSVLFEAQYRGAITGNEWVSMVSHDDVLYHTHYWSAGMWNDDRWYQIDYGSTDAAQYTAGAVYTPAKGTPHYGETGFTWRWRPYSENNGFFGALPVAKDPAPDPKYTTSVPNLKLLNGNTNTVRHTIASGLFVEHGDPGTIEVRVRRVTEAYTSTTIVVDFACSAIRAFQSSNYSVTDMTSQRRLGLKIKATGQLNGMVNALNCVASARVKAGTSPYAPTIETSNPAWCLLDFVRGRRNARGQRMYGVCLQESRIDLDAIAAWGAWCEAHGLEFNGVLDSKQSCAEVLQTIARCGRASVTWNTGRLGVVWDAESLPVTAVFGMSNIRAGSFSIQYATGTLADEVVMNFVNRETGWQRDTLRVSKPGVTDPVNPVELEIFGVTSSEQAAKEAHLLIAGNVYRRRTITWETDVEGLVVTRGDVVMLSHDLTQWGYSGRVVDFAGGVRLNRTVPVVAGANYLLLRSPEGAMTTLTVSNAEGETDLLTGTLPDTTGTNPMDWLWFFGPQPTPGKKVKVVSVEPIDQLHVRLIAVDEEPGFYAAETNPNTYVPPESISLVAPRINRVSIRESITDQAGYWQPLAKIDWSVENARDVVCVVTQNGSVIHTQTYRESTPALEFPAAIGDVIAVSLVPVSFIGVRGTTGTATATMTGAAITAPPADIPRVNAVYEGKIIWLAWEPVDDFRGITYEVRWGESWGAGFAYPTGSVTRFKTVGDGNYWVRAKTANGVYSSIAKGIRVEGSALVDNVIASLEESSTGWAGDFDRTYKIGGELSMAGTSLFSSFAPVSSIAPSVILAGGFDSEGYYHIPTDHRIDIGLPGACQVTTGLTFDVRDPNAMIGDVTVFSALPSVKCPLGGTGSVDVEMNIAQADGVFSGWQSFSPGTYLGRIFDFRLRLTSDNAAVSPFVSTWEVAVDVPDRIDSAEVTTPAGPLTVVFVKPFNATPKIQATIQNAQAGDDVVVSGISQNGMTLTVKSGGSNVSRTIHYLAQGY